MSVSTTSVATPTSCCRFGIGRVDVTPPVGIYHRFWGAAAHDRATGVHRPLTATAVILQPHGADEGAELHAFVAIDHCLLRDDDMQRLREEAARLIETQASITYTFSHTHSGGHICRSRADLPGGELIGPYLDSLPEKIAAAYRAALESLQPAALTYARVTCNMGRHRDFWDEASKQYVCGFNPDEPLDLPLNVVRVTAEDDARPLASIVSYPCHPTTLAWDNTLISPDYVGALREVVEQATGVPCLFLQGASGDVGPRDGFVGDTAVADRNGRQVGYAALSAIESMPAPETDYHYNGPVLSGATIGEWRYRPHSAERRQQTRRFRHRHWEVALPYRSGLQTVAGAEAELELALQCERNAIESGGPQAAAEFRALAERSRRLIERLRPLPAGDYPFSIDVWQMGDAFWVAVEGEPYHALEQDLNGRFPDTAVVLFSLAGGARCSYLPTRAAYEKKLYQVDVALLEAGCLEKVTDEIAAQIESWS